MREFIKHLVIFLTTLGPAFAYGQDAEKIAVYLETCPQLRPLVEQELQLRGLYEVIADKAALPADHALLTIKCEDKQLAAKWQANMSGAIRDLAATTLPLPRKDIATYQVAGPQIIDMILSRLPFNTKILATEEPTGKTQNPRVLIIKAATVAGNVGSIIRTCAPVTLQTFSRGEADYETIGGGFVQKLEGKNAEIFMQFKHARDRKRTPIFARILPVGSPSEAALRKRIARCHKLTYAETGADAAQTRPPGLFDITRIEQSLSPTALTIANKQGRKGIVVAAFAQNQVHIGDYLKFSADIYFPLRGEVYTPKADKNSGSASASIINLDMQPRYAAKWWAIGLNLGIVRDIINDPYTNADTATANRRPVNGFRFKQGLEMEAFSSFGSAVFDINFSNADSVQHLAAQLITNYQLTRTWFLGVGMLYHSIAAKGAMPAVTVTGGGPLVAIRIVNE